MAHDYSFPTFILSLSILLHTCSGNSTGRGVQRDVSSVKYQVSNIERKVEDCSDINTKLDGIQRSVAKINSTQSYDSTYGPRPERRNVIGDAEEDVFVTIDGVRYYSEIDGKTVRSYR